jgi:hypothetical protein
MTEAPLGKPRLHGALIARTGCAAFQAMLHPIKVNTLIHVLRRTGLDLVRSLYEAAF